jgi:hypothetical protein
VGSSWELMAVVFSNKMKFAGTGRVGLKCLAIPKRRRMDGTGDHRVKQNKPDEERQISHVLCHKWNPDPKKLRTGV